MFPTLPGIGLQEAIGPVSLLKSEVLAAGILVFILSPKFQAPAPSEAMAEQEWPASSLSSICKAG